MLIDVWHGEQDCHISQDKLIVFNGTSLQL